MQKAVLVVGGAGYIGAHVAHELKQQPYPVVVLDNLVTGHKQTASRFEFVYGDACDKDLLAQVFKTYNIDTVMHFAAHTSVPDSVAHPLKYYDNNVLSTIRLLQACEQYAVKKFVFSSTAAVYGNTPSKPVKETFLCKPVTPYGQSKLIAEQIIEDCAKSTGIQYVIMRYFNVAGANTAAKLGQNNQATHLIQVAIQVALRQRNCFPLFGDNYSTQDGTCVRDFIHIQDLAQAHVLAKQYLDKQQPSVTLNCGYGHGFSVKQVLRALEQVCGQPIPTQNQPRRAGDCPIVIADNSKIKQCLKWQPQHDDLVGMIESAYAWERTKIKHVTHSEVS